MKSERGITLVSLIVYVIVMLIVVTIISVLTTYFYTNVQSSNEKYSYLGEYTKFNSYFSEEVNKKGNTIVDCPKYEEDTKSQRYIVFSSNNEINIESNSQTKTQYTYIPANKAIYQNNVKIASGVEKCNFDYKIINGKEAVEVTIKVGNEEKKTTTYILNN